MIYYYYRILLISLVVMFLGCKKNTSVIPSREESKEEAALVISRIDQKQNKKRKAEELKEEEEEEKDAYHRKHVNEIDKDGKTMLYRVLRGDDKSLGDNAYERIKYLLDMGADPSIGNPKYNILKEAGSKGRDPRIFSLLLCQLGRLGRKDNFGLPALHWACKDGYLDAVKVIFESNPSVDIHSRDPYYKFTPLHWAARRGHKEIVKLLLAKGADKTVTSRHGFTPRMLALCNEYDDLKELLTPDGVHREKKYKVNREKKEFHTDENCSICLAVMDQSVKSTPCGHRFHQECLNRWFQERFQERKTCPYCRSLIIEGSYQDPHILKDLLNNHDDKTLESLLKQGADPTKYLDSNDLKDVFISIGNHQDPRDLKIFDLLLEYGVDPNFDLYKDQLKKFNDRHPQAIHVISKLLQHGFPIRSREVSFDPVGY